MLGQHRERDERAHRPLVERIVGEIGVQRFGAFVLTGAAMQLTQGVARRTRRCTTCIVGGGRALDVLLVPLSRAVEIAPRVAELRQRCGAGATGERRTVLPSLARHAAEVRGEGDEAQHVLGVVAKNTLEPVRAAREEVEPRLGRARAVEVAHALETAERRLHRAQPAVGRRGAIQPPQRVVAVEVRELRERGLAIRTSQDDLGGRTTHVRGYYADLPSTR